MTETELKVWKDYQKRVRKAAKELAVIFKQWEPSANRAVTICESLAPNLVQIRRKVNIARLTGSGVSLGLGVPMMVAGTVLIPFTFGISSALIGIGTGISVAGGITSGGATITEFSVRNNKLKELKELQLILQELSPQLEAASINLHAILLDSFHIFSTGVAQISGVAQNPEKLQVLSRTVWTILTLGGAAFRIASSTGDDVVKLIGTGTELGTALTTTSARIAMTSVFAAVAAAVDIYTILDSSRNMSESGNRYEAVKKLEQTAMKIEGIRGQVMLLLDRAEGIANGDASDVMQLARDMFSCCLCHNVAEPPLIRCQECLGWIGCEKCAVRWLAQNQECPKCEVKWPTDFINDEQKVLEATNLLLELRASDESDQNNTPLLPKRNTLRNNNVKIPDHKTPLLGKG